MTVAELIKELETYPMDATIHKLEFIDDYYECTDLFEVHCKEPVKLLVNDKTASDYGMETIDDQWIITVDLEDMEYYKNFLK